jgi:hypothetical protein
MCFVYQFQAKARFNSSMYSIVYEPQNLEVLVCSTSKDDNFFWEFKQISVKIIKKITLVPLVSCDEFTFLLLVTNLSVMFQMQVGQRMKLSIRVETKIFVFVLLQKFRKNIFSFSQKFSFSRTFSFLRKFLRKENKLKKFLFWRKASRTQNICKNMGENENFRENFCLNENVSQNYLQNLKLFVKSFSRKKKTRNISQNKKFHKNFR